MNKQRSTREEIQIRLATVQDAEVISRIYDPYVENTAISFEYDAPSCGEMKRRISNTLKEYPYLAAVWEGRVVGYAYAGSFHARAAYRHTAEVSIYIAEDCCRMGIGSLLYQELEKLLVRQNVFVLYACITMTPRKKDARLTSRSIRFHEKMGYQMIGRHEQCGYKFDRWYGIVWMEKVIAQRPEHPEPFLPFADLQSDCCGADASGQRDSLPDTGGSEAG